MMTEYSYQKVSNIEIAMYKILRKLGVQRDEIKLETSFNRDLFFDEKDWLCFLFLVESNMNIDLNDKMAKNMNTVGDALAMVKQQVNTRYQLN